MNLSLTNKICTERWKNKLKISSKQQNTLVNSTLLYSITGNISRFYIVFTLLKLKEKLRNKLREVSKLIYVLKCKLISSNCREWKIVDVYYVKKKRRPEDEFEWVNEEWFKGLNLTTTETSRKKIENHLEES